jgi:signal transduction histidine kinase
MEELTAAFLLLARESDQALAKEWVSVNDIVSGEIDRVRVVASDAAVKVESRDNCTLMVLAPEKVLASVIGNLIRNGMSYTDAGSVCVTIEERRIVIEDTGAGMAPEEVEKVFKPFYRAGRRRGGHGVGLTIVVSA